uniref:DUF928 domain-containing protein n=1 Tax=Cyanothece sp. (strain PCC 7425 / ATCC 29141) TaxID=395961 RepID=B8HY23_CYAP4
MLNSSLLPLRSNLCRQFPYRLRFLSACLSLGLLLPAGTAWAGFIPPENLGRPGNREGAATRSECKTDRKLPLTALVPLSNIGLTTDAYPTFYWYFPTDNTFKYWQFKLYRVDRGGSVEETPLYQSAKQPFNGEVGLDSFSLPQSQGTGLDTDRDYRWEISLLCNPDEPDAVVFADGWIRRVTPSPNLETALATAQPFERYDIYAKAGLWYDALKSLMDLRQQQPNNPTLNSEWMELLQSQAVQLDALVNQRLSQK